MGLMMKKKKKKNLERRETSSLRWAERVSSTRSLILGIRPSLGCLDMTITVCVLLCSSRLRNWWGVRQNWNVEFWNLDKTKKLESGNCDVLCSAEPRAEFIVREKERRWCTWRSFITLSSASLSLLVFSNNQKTLNYIFSRQSFWFRNR